MADDRPDPDLYERDFYAWTQVQADALRSGAADSNVIEWERVAEEIADLGSEQRNAVRSHLLQVIIHLYKLETSRARQPRNHWRVEVRNHRLEAELRLTRTIRNAMERELDGLHVKAARLAQAAINDEEIDLTVDASMRWSLTELMGEADDALDRRD